MGGTPVSDESRSRRQAAKKRESILTTVKKSDPYIWGIYVTLVVVSIIELYSASSSEVVGSNVYAPLLRHGMFLAIGFVLLYLIQSIHYGYIKRFASVIGILSWLALAYSSFMGVEINGAQRAFMIGPLTVQPPRLSSSR